MAPGGERPPVRQISSIPEKVDRSADPPPTGVPFAGAGALFARVRPWLGPVALLAMVAVFTLLNPGTFLTKANLVDNVLASVSYLAILASVQTVVMVVGDYDLSIGTLAAFAMVMCGSLVTTEINGVANEPASLVLAIGLGLLIGMLGGLVNGMIVAYLGFTAFIATLITSQIWEGLTLKRSNGQPIYNLVQDNFVSFGQGETFGIPNVIYVAAAVALLVWFLLDQTPLGRRMYAVGGNADAARFSGIDVKRIKLVAFVIAGLGAAVAGILISANNGTASLNGPPALMLPSIAAVFLGMAVLRDGRPNLPGTILGVVMLRVLESGLNQSGVDSYTLQIVSAVVVFLAVLPSALGRLRDAR